MARRKFDINSLPSNNLEPVDKDISVVTTGRVKTRKGGGIANEIRGIGNSLFETIILPAMKSAVVDFFSNGVDMVVHGRSSGSPRGVGGHTSYNKRYKTRQKPWQNRSSRQNIQQTEEVFEDIFFDERDDAELVLGRMMELVHEYGQATMGDLYSMCGLSPNYIHEDWGWNNLNNCRVQYTMNGYVIDFPEPGYRR